jgi:hypothetical protein
VGGWVVGGCVSGRVGSGRVCEWESACEWRMVREGRVVREMELGVSCYARTVAAFVLCSHLSLAFAAFAV